jgi:hypothetical protein
MIHDGKRDGWDMLLAESEAVRKAISYQDTCVPLHPHSMVENESPGFFLGFKMKVKRTLWLKPNSQLPSDQTSRPNTARVASARKTEDPLLELV